MGYCKILLPSYTKTMKTKIFVNLAIKNLEKTKDFFSKLGYSFNPQFTDEKAACMIVDENIYVMLVIEEFFTYLTTKPVLDAQTGAECTVALSMENKEKVEEWADKALSLGATENKIPHEMNAGENMYTRSLNDLDGHIWEVFWMDPKTIQK